MRTRNTQPRHANPLVMAKSRGAITGLLLMALGAWAALIPFFGHSFGYGFTPNNTWTWTNARGWLEVLPGAAVFVGGALLVTSGNRFSAMVGGWLAAVAGAWLVIGTVITPFWNAGNIGVPTGNAHHAAWERLGMFDGLGVVVILLAAIALGRSSVVGVRDVAAAQSRREARIQAKEDARQIDLNQPAPAATTEASNAHVSAPATTTDTTSTRTTKQPISSGSPTNE
jgi:hypothetical protein